MLGKTILTGVECAGFTSFFVNVVAGTSMGTGTLTFGSKLLMLYLPPCEIDVSLASMCRL